MKTTHKEFKDYNIQIRAEPYGDEELFWVRVQKKDNSTMAQWQDLQDIKNTFFGPEFEGFQIFPAESRLVDEGNAYHLWVFKDPTMRLKYGFKTRRT